ncbi:MAG TPA: YDG domain-containing protein [Planctomycetota bacterium]
MLDDGRVLVAGGTTNSGAATASAEVYDPTTSTWSAVGAMAQPRTKGTALRLREGLVVIVGGENAGGALTTLELFDAFSGSFTTAFASIQPPRTAMASVMLPDGRVLITGGSEGVVPSTRTEIYDPVANILTPGPYLTTARAEHSATRLQSGEILVVGGTDGSADLGTAEILGFGSNLFAPLPAALTTARRGHVATLLRYNGSVLITGGTGNSVDLLSAERFLPWNSTFVDAGSMSAARPGGVVGPTSLDGVFIAAGGGSTTSSDLYSFPTVKTDFDDYAPGSTALISGSGFQASSVVTLQVVHLRPTVPAGAGHTPWLVATGPLGEFATTWYVDPDDSFGATLQLSADCAGEHAEHVFTDAAASTASFGLLTEATYGSTTTFALTVTNTSFPNPSPPTDNPTIGSITVAVPTGMTVTGTPTIAAYDGAGTMTPRTWEYDTSSTALLLKFRAVGGTPNEINSPEGHADISFTATANSVGSKTWTTKAWTSRSYSSGGTTFAPLSPTVTIDPAPLAITANDDSKTYNAIAYTGGNGVSYSGFVLGENSSVLGGSLTYSGTSQGAVNAGMYAITPGGLTSTNYAIGYTDGTLTVAQKALTITATTDSRIYDGTTASAVAPIASGLAGSDTVTGLDQVFDAKHAGPRTLSVSAYTVNDGNSGNNYNVSTPTAAGSISAVALAISATADSKTYDGTTASAAMPTFGTLYDTDTVTGLDQVFDSKNAGSRTLSVSAYTVNDGNSGGNYAVTTPTAAGSIGTRALIVSATGINKVYDANDTATVTLSDNRVPGDGLDTSYTSATFASADVGTWSVAVSGISISGLDAANYTFNTGAVTTAAIIAAPTTPDLTVVAASVQYSDLSTFTATLSPSEIVGNAPATGVQFKVNGNDIGGVQALAANAGSLTASLVVGEWDVLPLAPGNYTVTAVFTGVNPNFAVSSPSAASLAVTREDARANYTGLTYVSTASASSSTATVLLSATIQDITAALPGSDAEEGDIRNATVTFVNRDNNTNIATVPVGLVNPLDVKTGTANYTWTANIGNSDCETYTIGIVVNNRYTRNSGNDDTVVTVKRATPGSIGGGGFLVNSASQGQYAGDTGLKTNFGLNVKFNRSLSNLQGKVNAIVRSGGRVYQIKSNSIQSLSIAPIAGGHSATFTSKANLTDITDPLNPVALGGNLNLQVKMRDLGEPGSSDKISVSLTNTGGAMLFASNWNGTQVVEQLLGGGNLQVRQ